MTLDRAKITPQPIRAFFLPMYLDTGVTQRAATAEMGADMPRIIPISLAEPR